MTETFCTSGAVKLKAGENVDTSLTGANYTDLIEEAEGFFCVSSRFDWIAVSGSVSTVGKYFLEEGIAAYAAIDAMSYNPSGYTSRTEYQTKLDVLWSKVVECINLLRDEKFRNFILKGNTN